MTRETIEQDVPTTETITETFVLCDACGEECTDEYETHGDYHTHPNCELGIPSGGKSTGPDRDWVGPAAAYYMVAAFVIMTLLAASQVWFSAYFFGATAMIAAAIYAWAADRGVTYHTPGRW